ncbi:MAG: MbnP family protein [Candidatus Latescibacterota bacterium]|mgnify:CR=1 FL=1
MKITTQIISALSFVAAVVLSGCGSDSNDGDQGTVTIHLDHSVAGSELVLETIDYRNAAGNEYGITRLEYIISDVYLERADGTRALLAEQHYRNAFDSETRSFSAPIDGNDYSALVFTFGIDGERNQTGALPNSDSYNNMAWPVPMGGGYHYMRFEGLYNSADAAASFLTHTGPSGGNDYSIDIALPLTLSVDGDEWEIAVVMDPNQWYEVPITYDLNGSGPIMGNPDIQAILQANGATAFTLDSLEPHHHDDDDADHDHDE